MTKPSRRDKLASFTKGLGETLDSFEVVEKAHHTPKTAPGHLLAFRAEAVAYEARIAELEKQLANVPSLKILVALIDPNPWQPRKTITPEDIAGLAANIAEIGQIQPIIVRRIAISETEVRYQLIAGERRWRAHQAIPLDMIDAVIIEVTDEQMAVMALAENINREDLSDYEIGNAIVRAEKDFPNRKHMAEAIGIPRRLMYRYLSFQALPQFILDDLNRAPGLLGGHAAEAVVALVKTNGEKAVEALTIVWPKVVAGAVDQGKIATEAAALLAEKTPSARTERDIRKLFVNTTQAGSITRDHSTLTVKIKTELLSKEKEEALRKFVQELLLKPS